MNNNNTPFRILSIDGGGIRGLFVARFLQEVEAKLAESGQNTELHKYFDLICGTSTGAIIALALSLGIPSERLVHLYSTQAKSIFPRIPFLTKLLALFRRIYSRKNLEKEIQSLFKEYGTEMGLTNSPRIGHAKTRLCIPSVYMHEGQMQVLKTPHHSKYQNDYHIPMYQAALASASAPIYFSPFSIKYKYQEREYSRKYFADGGLVANNPAHIGYVEATEILNQKNVMILSFGTGENVFRETKNKWMKFIPRWWSAFYWVKGARILDLIMQSQSQQVHNILQIIKKYDVDSGINLTYQRVQFDFCKDDAIKLDESNPETLDYLKEKALRLFQAEWSSIVDTFFQSKASKYSPNYNIEDEPH